jgi:hypothetical protein
MEFEISFNNESYSSLQNLPSSIFLQIYGAFEASVWNSSITCRFDFRLKFKNWPVLHVSVTPSSSPLPLLPTLLTDVPLLLPLARSHLQTPRVRSRSRARPRYTRQLAFIFSPVTFSPFESCNAPPSSPPPFCSTPTSAPFRTAPHRSSSKPSGQLHHRNRAGPLPSWPSSFIALPPSYFFSRTKPEPLPTPGAYLPPSVLLPSPVSKRLLRSAPPRLHHPPPRVQVDEVERPTQDELIAVRCHCRCRSSEPRPSPKAGVLASVRYCR